MTKQNLTVKDLVDWIMLNRKGKAFIDWKADSLAIVLLNKLRNREAGYTIDSDGNITGVCMIEIAIEYKRVHVNHILTTSKDALKKLIAIFKLWYPGWDMQAERKNERLVLYDTPKLIHKIESLT